MASSSKLFIDLDAIMANYQYLDKLSDTQVQTGASVKANGYGLGMTAISQALYQAGCRTFFIAQIDEGVALSEFFSRQKIGDAVIVVFAGPSKHECEIFSRYQLTPVINHLAQAKRIAAYTRKTGLPLPAILHIDTAMSRLGISKDQHHMFYEGAEALEDIDLICVMSHLACADQPDHPLNTDQLSLFSHICEGFVHTQKSLANSAGLFLGAGYHFDLTRPGIGLYGVSTNPYHHNKHLTPAFRWEADIVQIREIAKGETAGYGAEYIAAGPCRLATIAAGYADGYSRALFRPDEGIIATISILGYAVPLAGRVSMDMITVDITAIPEQLLNTATTATLIGSDYDIQNMARDRKTIGYEVMTGLGERVTRLYDAHIKG